ncbi:ABC1 kinase family protein [Lutibaculum baratangense]|nr:AarF/ABC1/UbiB kinase family protein [Lutibaculum baratangense]
MSERDDERNRFSARALRYARVGTNVGGNVARLGASRLMGVKGNDAQNAAALAAALGGLKGPAMKVVQLLANIPDVLPPEYSAEFAKLQASAPPMGYPFVKRRMVSELGSDWRQRFAEFSRDSAASASLGQVHKARDHEGRALAAKLQYPDMASAVEADLRQLGMLLQVQRRISPEIDAREAVVELGERLREELDYKREASHIRLYAEILKDHDQIRVPGVHEQLSTKRLLVMDWLEGRPLSGYEGADQETRNFLSECLFRAWWYPFAHYAVIHGDPHMGNYTVFEEAGAVRGINLLDYGCIRIFPPSFIQGVIDLYEGLKTDDRERIVHAYRTWGFKSLDNELVDILNIWARFIYGPMLEDRVRVLANDVGAAEYGRREAFRVKQELKRKGPVTIPREFVFMDRAAVGLGGVFLRMKCELNFYRLFNETIEGFDLAAVADRQRGALERAQVPTPDFLRPM